jgi:hypothetical protein
MKKVRIVLLSMFAVLAMGVVASSAQAAPCASSPGNQCLDLNGELTATTNLTTEIVAGSKSELEIEGLGKIVCNKVGNSATSVIEEPAAGGSVLIMNAVIEFSGECKLVGTTCKVTEAIKTLPLDGTITFEGAVADVTFTPEGEAGKDLHFADIILSNCEQEATLKITRGTTENFVLCTVEKPEELIADHTIVCANAGKTTGLLGAGKPAGFTIKALVLVTGGVPWAILKEQV